MTCKVVTERCVALTPMCQTVSHMQEPDDVSGY
jgi:hypothetical protein